jgi:uncharacterized protein (DUF433 family)
VSQNNSIPGRTFISPSESWIQKTPEVCGGDACIRTTRIPIWSLVEARRLGFSDQELLNHYDPPLTQADLDTAWAYFDNHRNEIEQAIRENEDA